jgi:hypothetical protein
MNAAALIRELEQHGVHLEAADGRLRWEAPSGVLTADLLEALRVHKLEVMELLTPAAPDSADLRELAAAWRGAARELAELAGYPRLPFRPGLSVAPGAANWGTYVTRASVPDLRLVVGTLREFIAAMPLPERDR